MLRENLQSLLRKYNIKSILDSGCGDANLFKHLDLTGIKYHGVDCVEDMIAKNKLFFAKNQNIGFECADVTQYKIPKVDLIISRDVTHYLPNDLIRQFLDKVMRSGAKYLLITHNLASSASANCDTEIGIFRPVNLLYPPFNFPQPLEVILEDTEYKSLALWKLSDLNL